MSTQQVRRRGTARVDKRLVLIHCIVLHCKVHNCLLLINRQRFDNNVSTQSGTGSPKSISAVLQAQLAANKAGTLKHSSDAEDHRGRPQVILSSVAILDAFQFTHCHLPATLIDWTIGQQAFNATMILLLEMEEQQNLDYLNSVEKAFNIFLDLFEKGIHKLARLAVECITTEHARLLESLEESRAGSESSRRISQLSASSRRDSRTSSQSASDLRNQSMYHGTDGTRIHQPFSDEDTVMSGTGMFVLEDRGIAPPVPGSFLPRADDAPYDGQFTSQETARDTRLAQQAQAQGQFPGQASRPASQYGAGLAPLMSGQSSVDGVATTMHNERSRSQSQRAPDQRSRNTKQTGGRQSRRGGK